MMPNEAEIVSVCSECGKPVKDSNFPVCDDCLRNRPIRTVEDLEAAVKDQLEDFAEHDRELEEALDRNVEGTPIGAVQSGIARIVRETYSDSGKYYGVLQTKSGADREMSGEIDFEALNKTRKLARLEEIRQKIARGEPLTRKERKIVGGERQSDPDMSIDLASGNFDPMEIRRIMLKRQMIHDTVPRERESKSAVKRRRRKITKIDALLNAACDAKLT